MRDNFCFGDLNQQFQFKCTPNTVFGRDGSTCVCDVNGDERCETIKIYPNCEPYGLVSDGCNTCNCDGNGKIFTCTRRSCFVPPVPCDSGKSYKIDCNLCTCETNGELNCENKKCGQI